MHNHWRQFNSFNSKDTLYIIWFFQWFGCALTNNCAGLYIRSVSEIWNTWTGVIYFYDHQLLNWHRKLCSTSFASHSHLAHSSLILLGCSLSLWHSYGYSCSGSQRLFFFPLSCFKDADWWSAVRVCPEMGPE